MLRQNLDESGALCGRRLENQEIVEFQHRSSHGASKPGYSAEQNIHRAKTRSAGEKTKG